MSNETQLHVQKHPPVSNSPENDDLIRQRVEADMPALTGSVLAPANVLQLQRVIGNQAVQRLIARKPRASAKTPVSSMIQRRGTYAPIAITQANNILAVEEQEFATGPTVAFTAITSCVGFLARSGNQITGLHLGVLDAGGVDVSTINQANLLAAIQAIWPGNLDAVFQVGMVNNWTPAVLNGLYPTLLNAAELDSDLNSAGSVYSATVNANGMMEVTKNNVLIYTET